VEGGGGKSTKLLQEGARYKSLGNFGPYTFPLRLVVLAEKGGTAVRRRDCQLSYALYLFFLYVFIISCLLVLISDLALLLSSCSLFIFPSQVASSLTSISFTNCKTLQLTCLYFSPNKSHRHTFTTSFPTVGELRQM
jgi:hypothetical protein